MFVLLLVKGLVTEGEFSKTKEIVDNFQNGVGEELHSKLLHKAASERNWVFNIFTTFILTIWFVFSKNALLFCFKIAVTPPLKTDFALMEIRTVLRFHIHFLSLEMKKLISNLIYCKCFNPNGTFFAFIIFYIELII